MEKMKHEHHNIYYIDTIAYNSKMKDWSPGFKIILALLSLASCIISKNISAPIFIIITMAALSICIGKTDPRYYFKLMILPFAFIICGTAAIAVGFSAEPFGQYMLDLNFFFIYTTDTAMSEALKTALKALGAVSSLYMLTLSTPISETMAAMRKLHIPKLIIELMNMIYRFIFILARVHHGFMTSAKSRLGYYGTRTSLRTFGIVAANLFIVSLKKAGTYYDALESRCYTGELLFLTIEKPVKKKQIIFAIIYFMCVVTLIFFKI